MIALRAPSKRGTRLGSAVALDTPVLSDPEILHHRMVKLDWQDIEGADSYEVQFYNSNKEWVALPAGDVEGALDGSSAVVSDLPEGVFWWLQVWAVSPDGESEWSEIVMLFPTDASDWDSESDSSPATGRPIIGGTAQVGETLTADTSGISDADSLANATFSYQWLADDADISGTTGSTYTMADADEGKSIKVRVSFTDDRGNEETLTSAATAAVVAAPTPLTAEFLDTPESHDGQSAFTFELRFSEHFGLSYKTLRDHAFTVTGGEVTKARRLERGSNIRWEISVRPSSNGDVTIVLPVTEDCEAQGAVCTGDGRPLSNRLELTVSGPSG